MKIHLQLLLGLLLSLASLLLSSVGAKTDLVRNPVPGALGILLDLSEKSFGGSRGTVLEVRVLLAGVGTEFIDGGGLGNLDAVAVEVGLELTLAPGVKDARLGGVGGGTEVAGDGGVAGTAGRRSRAVGRLSSAQELVTGGILLLSSLLGSSVAAGREVLLEVLDGEIIEGPGRPAGSSLVLVLADKSTELVSLGALGNGNATGVEVSLEAALGPRSNSLVECLLSGARSTISSLSSSLVDVGSRSPESVRGLASDVAVKEVGAVLADESAELVGLGALGDWGVVRLRRFYKEVNQITYQECRSCQRTP